MSILQAKNVHYIYQSKYQKVHAVKGIDFTFQEGKFYAIVGKSGCGKTTVSKLLLGLEKAKQGTVLAPQKISCVFQEDRLLNHLTLKKNIFLVIPKERQEFALKLAEELGLKESLTLKPTELSGGMKRRVAIIRAIAFSGDALILDEAFNGLDTQNKIKIANIIKQEFILKDKPVLMITHIEEDAALLVTKTINFSKKNPL